MTKITRITAQRKSKSRYNIFLDDGQGEKFAFSVDEDVLIKYNLRKDLEIDDTMIITLTQEDSIHKSYNQVIGYLGYRMRTKREIHDYLAKKEVDEEHIIKIMDKLIERNLVDDAEFAALFVNTRIQTTAKGPTLVKQELIQKGVSSKIANEAVKTYSYGVQYEKAAELVEKRLKRGTSNSFRKQLQQLRAALMRSGFTQDVIKDVMADIQEEKDEDAEYAALVHHGERLRRLHQVKLTGYELRNKLKEALYRQGFAIRAIERYLDESIEE